MGVNQQAGKLQFWAPLFQLQEAVGQHVGVSGHGAGHVDHVSLVTPVKKEQSVGGLAIECSSSLEEKIKC